MRSKKKVDRLVHEILSVLKENKDESMGATAISRELEERGFEIGERAVRYHLKHLDDKGLTEKLSPRKGRMITDKGEEELKTELVGERVGFVLGRIEELIYEMDYDLEKDEGTIITNISLFDKGDIDPALGIMADVMDEGWAPSHLIKLAEEGGKIGNLDIPGGKVGMATVCSITMDGVLVNEGIPVSPKFGGLLELEGGEPERFVEAIAYEGTSIDPLEIFASKRMTSNLSVLESGSGRILANLREIPIPARPHALDVIERAEERNMNAVLKVGTPADSLYDLPVGVNRVGVAIAGGINPAVAVDESGINVRTNAMECIIPISQMDHIENHL